MKRGEDTMMPNWALDAMQAMTLATDIRVLCWLTRHRHYRGNTYSTKQLSIALEIDPRTMRESLERLRGQGLILSHEGAHCSADAMSKLPASQVKAAAKSWEQKSRREAREVQGPRNAAAMLVQKDPACNSKNTVSDDVNLPLNKGTNEVRNTYLLTGGESASAKSEVSESSAEGQDPAQVAGVPDLGADAPAASAAQHLPPPSRVKKDSSAGQKTLAPNVGSSEAGAADAPLVREDDVVRDADGEAMRLFARIVNANFVNNNRFHLQSWAEQYTPEFIELAWNLAKSGKSGAHVPAVGLVWLLQGTKPWPSELQARFEADQQAKSKPAQRVASDLKPGDLLRFADGETVSVLRLDSAHIVTDSENEARGYIRFTALGSGVQVVSA